MHDNRIRILQVIGNARLGGVATCLLNYFNRIDLKKYRFDFVTYSPSVFDEKARSADPKTHIYYIYPFQKNFLKGISGLEKICRKGEYSAVHSHLTTLSSFALTAAAKAQVPVRICHAHSAFNKNSEHYLIKSFLRPFATEQSTHLMACSRHAAKNTFGKRAKDAVILPDAIEAEKFYSSEKEYYCAREKLGLSGKVAVFVGRFVYQKNLPLLIKAFAKASLKENMTLALIGDGEDRLNVRKAVEEYGINDKVRIVPPCNPAEWYKAADVFCLPSRYEGLGMSAIEAQASGLKCLLSKAVPAEADITGNCVFLPDDADVWAEELIASAEHFYDCKEKIISAGYDIEREAHRLTDFYDRAINGLK